MKGEKKTIRTHKRANLKFPSHAIRKELKGKITKRKFEKNVEVSITAHLEYVISRLLLNAADNVTSGKYIDAKHIHTAINEKGGELENVFPTHITGMF